MRSVQALVVRDLALGIRRPSEILNPLIFFVMVLTLFPLGVGPSPEILARIAPGIIWVAALLATLLGLDSLFRTDYEDGALDQLLVGGNHLPLMALSKVLVHWILSAVPLLILTPLMGLMMHLDWAAIRVLWLSLLIGSPLLSIIGALGAALTVGVKRGSVLLSLLILPLYVPVLIFGTSAVSAAAMGLDYNVQIAILGAMLALALSLAPLVIAAALRVSVS
ncbi:MAG: heme exporter protein CcmB [Kangiellaceae bacterium]|nr:heme exporter protein CcmB [Kangiellaceae bacterium]|tara:strand:+ start:4804 stop:5469 length:666 start_codon:yes stop_codon:yes gene_type:complete